MRTFLPRILFVFLVICAYTFADHHEISTPEECKRICKDGEPPKTCYYKFRVEWYTTVGLACLENDTLAECVQTDGVETGIMTVNRQIPGPSIEVCEGDKVVVDVENKADGSSITFHWHGLFQQDYQYYDGVPFITQCPIIGGTTFRYAFAVNNAGTHMYHSHESVQTILGQYGPFIVRTSPKNDPHSGLYQVDNHVILISDIMHDGVAPGRLPGKIYENVGEAPSNLLVNGLGINKDRATNTVTNLNNITRIEVTQGKRYRFRMINILSSVCLVEVSIEKHRPLLIAQDGENVEPEYADKINLASGERVDFVLDANQEIMDYWILVRGITECEPLGIYQIATLHYAGAIESASPIPDNNTVLATGVTYNPVDVADCGKSDEKLCVTQLMSVEEEDPRIMSDEAHYRFAIVFGFDITEDISQKFSKGKYGRFFIPPTKQAYSSTMNNVSYFTPSSPAILHPEALEQPLNQCEDYCEGFNYYQVRRGSIVEYYLFDQNNFSDLAHPFHLHGYAFHNMEEGKLKTVPPTRQEMREIMQRHQSRIRNGGYRGKQPSKKDTIKVSPGGYVIIRFRANNPGWWLFHCHFLWHTVTGMDAVVHVGKPRDLPPIPHNFPKCGNFQPEPIFYS